MRRISYKQTGETIVEVMVAMAIASILVVSAIQLMGRSYTIVGETNRRIEGLTLAQEGVENIRNFRDTNWLKYSGDRRNNWMKIQAVGTTSATDLSSIYRSWVQLDASNNLSVVDYRTAVSEYQVLNGNTNNANVSLDTFRLYRDTDGVLSHINNTDSTPSPYYRVIQVLGSLTTKEKVTVQSEVFWKKIDSDAFDKAVIKTDLYDFYENN